MLRQSVKQFGLKFEISDLSSNTDYWNLRIFPHGSFPVVIEEDGHRIVKEMNYSLIPNWSNVRKPKFSTYNCRLETICEKPTWRTPVQSRRCLVGLTSFFESCYQGSHSGNVVEFISQNEELLVAAGIWEQWVDKTTGELVNSFAIITHIPNDFIKSVGHDRSPLFLPQATDVLERWLKPHSISCQSAKDFLLENKIYPELSVKIERPLKPGWKSRS